MRYTQKDVRRVLGLSRDMLRLYERRGIIHPEVDPQNGYRYYDDWQVNLLWECKRYQAMGFSLAEIKEMTSSDDLATLSGRIDAGAEALAQQLAYEQLVLENYRQLAAALDALPGCLGTFAEEMGEELVYVLEREVHDLLVTAGAHPETGFINEHMGFCRPLAIFKGGRDRYYWGFAARADAYKAQGGPASTGALRRMPATHVLVTWVDAGGRGNFGLHLFEGLFDEARRRGLRVTGDLYCYLLARATDEAGYHRYIKALLPCAADTI